MLYNESTIISGIKCQLVPRRIESLYLNRVVIRNIFCGKDFTFAFNDSYDVYSWGNNDYSQLARKVLTSYDSKPQLATYLTFDDIRDICCGWMHVICLTVKGEVYMWGNPYYDYDKQYNDIKEPKKIELHAKASKIASGFHHMAAICPIFNSFELLTWGVNDYGQLGYKTNKEISPEPKIVSFHDHRVIGIFCGAFHTLCTMMDDKIFAFGHNLYYNLIFILVLKN